jgi:hypothetical protein
MLVRFLMFFLCLYFCFFDLAEASLHKSYTFSPTISIILITAIALHWLSDAGIVLWANQTELDVLGYTAEEYIGQPMNDR